MMIFITIKSWRRSLNYSLNKSENLDHDIKIFDQAWIIAFITFFVIHFFDITYFDGRISSLTWILLAGMRSIIEDYPKFTKLS